MIKNAISSFSPAFSEIFKDKVNLLLALIPIVFGLVIYYFFGSWLFGSVLNSGQELVREYISEGAMGSVLSYLITIFLTLLLFFLVNWTFVLVVSIMASPFNDILSGRIESKMRGKEMDSLQESFGLVMKKFIANIFNEAKKVSFIIILTLLAFALSFSAVLAPVSIFITITLLAIEFVDYSWSRHNLKFKECFSDLRKNTLGYWLGGGFFFIFVSIPVLNLLVPSVATSYFTIFWNKNNAHSS